jgi:hypothetical protein
MTGFGAAPNEKYLAQADLEQREAQRLKQERHDRLYGRQPSASPSTVVPLQKPADADNEASPKSNGHLPVEHAREQNKPVPAQVLSPPEFLRRVLPWPQNGAPGFINVHWRHQHYEGMPGSAFTRLADFIAFLPQALKRLTDIQDIYFCLSLQKEVGAVVHGRAKATRSKNNALAFKAIWIDVDVKPPPKGYATIEDALDAIKEFARITGLPSPSALIGSGGGVHIYWISDRPLTVEEWAPYAHGLRALAVQHDLRCDASVTIDAARVLRVPGTLNYKTTPPKEVKLLALEQDYEFEQVLGKIRVAVGPQQIKQVAWCSDPAKFPKRPIPPDSVLLTEAYRKEIGEVYEHEFLDPRPAIKGCPFLRNTFNTGGKDHDQGLWMQTALASTFLNGGRAIFHALSKGHADYDPENVDKMFDRKVGDREEKEIGWPSCQTFESYGSKQCAGCAHRGKIKSR